MVAEILLTLHFNTFLKEAFISFISIRLTYFLLGSIHITPHFLFKSYPIHFFGKFTDLSSSLIYITSFWYFLYSYMLCCSLFYAMLFPLEQWWPMLYELRATLCKETCRRARTPILHSMQKSKSDMLILKVGIKNIKFMYVENW